MELNKIHSTVYKILNENVKTIEDFYLENDIIFDKLVYLGGGEFGKAYSIGNGKVLKITTSKSEFELAKQMEGKNIPVLDSIAKIYKTDIIDGKMLIILEELELDSNIDELFYDLQNYLDEQGLSILYLHELDIDENEITDELKKFIDGMLGINKAYRYLNVLASDINTDNLGYSKNGKLKAFDIDDKK